MDTPHWPQGMGLVKGPTEEFASSMTTAAATATTSSNNPARPVADRRPRPSKEQALNCPRCNSTNTKFCYYNNYSLTQPRYFCKTCRRYWTEGGSLRNVPVGGGSRKNKRITSAAATAAAATASAAKKLRSPEGLADPSSYISLSTAGTPKAPKFLEGQDLNLAFHLPPFADYPTNLETGSNGAFPGVGSLSAMEMLKSRMPFMASMPMPTPPPAPFPLDYAAGGFGLQEFRPATLSFPLDATGGGTEDGGGGGGKFLFPFEDLKPVAASSNSIVVDQFEAQSKGQGGAGDPPGYWSGIINGGGSW